MPSRKALHSVQEPAAVYSVAEGGGASVLACLHARSALERDHMVRVGFEAASIGGLCLVYNLRASRSHL